MYDRRIARQLALTVLGFVLAVGSVWPAASPAGQRATPTPTPRPKSLADIAGGIRLNRTGGGASTGQGIVITDKNLKEYSEKGKLTTTGKPGTRGATGRSPYAGVRVRSDGVAAGKRRRWRAEYRRQLQLVDSIKKRMDGLHKAIGGLQSQFYAWDDPAYRDGVIKPKLDKALTEYDELKARLPKEEAKLPEILERARRDGGQPGWFRDIKR